MRVYTFERFSEKEVINCKDGKRLGCPDDIKFDAECGKIISFSVRDIRKFSFGKSDGINISWDCIEKIGDDIILVNLDWFPPPLPSHDKKDKKSFF